jgi:acyl-CoA synthetase (AMP-forming)/AMP-acid ligase II
LQRTLLPDHAEEDMTEAAPAIQRPRVAGSDTAFIQYTSGSTGNPKGVVISHANACHNVHAIGQAARIGRHDIVASWLPLYHDMGLVGTLLFSVYFRLPLVLMSPLAFLARPVRWLRAIHQHRVTLSPAPNFAYGLCVKRVSEAERAGLSTWARWPRSRKPTRRTGSRASPCCRSTAWPR